MDGDGQNYSVFNSRMLVDTVGDITDDALKASRIKDVIGVLVGRVFNWSQRKSLFPLHLGGPAGSTRSASGCSSGQAQGSATCCWSTAQSARSSQTR